MDRSPGLGVIPHLPQGLLGQSLDAADVEPTDGGQAEQEAGAVTTRPGRGDRRFQQRRRARRIAGVEVVLSCRNASSWEPCVVLGWCQPPGQLQQLSGRVRAAPGACVPACLLQRSCHAHMGTDGREGKVTRPLLRVIDELRQAAVHAPPGMGRGLGVDGRAQEWMGNSSRSPVRCRTPASSALVMPADARSRRSVAATTRSSVGRAVAATTRSPSAALGGSGQAAPPVTPGDPPEPGAVRRRRPPPAG